MTILGIYPDEAAEETDATAEVFIAAIFILIAALAQEAIASLEGIDHIVVLPIIAARGAYWIGRRCDDLGCEGGWQREKNQGSNSEFHRMNSGSAFDPWIRTWQFVQF